jgi:hypothetical protein
VIPGHDVFGTGWQTLGIASVNVVEKVWRFEAVI